MLPRLLSLVPFAGILAGTVSLVMLTLAGTTPVDLLSFLPAALRDVNAGMTALLAKLPVTGIVGVITQPRAALAVALPSADSHPRCLDR